MLVITCLNTVLFFNIDLFLLFEDEMPSEIPGPTDVITEDDPFQTGVELISHNVLCIEL